MSRYAIAYTPRAKRQLKAVRDRHVAHALRAAIEALAQDPRPPGVKKLRGQHEQWRVREGDWRIVYVIEDNRLVVLVVAVAKRDEVYRQG